MKAHKVFASLNSRLESHKEEDLICGFARELGRFAHGTPGCRGFRVQGAGCRVQGAGFRVQGPWWMVGASTWYAASPVSLGDLRAGEGSYLMLMDFCIMHL